MSDKNKMLSKLSNYIRILILSFGSLLLSNCNEQARGFALPKGDIEVGKATYKSLACAECHSISGIEWEGGSDSLNILLGGEVSTKKTYGDLVTSVINPSHKIAKNFKHKGTTEEGQSEMKNYNEVMTVQELVDLVTFLQSEYNLSVPPTDYFPYY